MRKHISPVAQQPSPLRADAKEEEEGRRRRRRSSLIITRTT